ncbi:hypothetical protein HN858_05825 [Candidatus Falkowbacteria bacterium]|jgi:hypothetical protein|nr:hypothetical protein [Candidatus Falkowbacteria bacterium]MBT5503306.1 hypothetical protein [Candidatus Falkowbacteria bacterium]MBT6573638.1 hypothetical protein [Candidatus Falkowbacteria bacterium]MBT7349156.1 hypothetical protein [Candidatus Falkowbacteria bacterium]MBT7500109.1 hypothetical protein [Candidatus Falkowbacteria bacterium]
MQLHKKKSKIPSVIILTIIILLLIIFLGLAEFLYFQPAEQQIDISNDGISIGSNSSKIEKEFTAIKEELLTNEEFINLQKNGDWPLQIDSIEKEISNPFDPTSEIVIEILEEGTITELVETEDLMPEVPVVE